MDRCAFELAAFAKRAGVDRMHIIPIHSPLTNIGVLGSQVAFTAALNITLLLAKLLGITYLSGITLLLVPTFIFAELGILYAMMLAQRSRDALARLRSFSIDECECHDENDRLALRALIGDWWSEEQRGASAFERQRLGLHRFQQYMRNDLRLHIEQRATSLHLSPQVKRAVLMFSWGASVLDVIAAPTTTLYSSAFYLLVIPYVLHVQIPLNVRLGSQLAQLIIWVSTDAVSPRMGVYGRRVAYTAGLLLCLLAFVAWVKLFATLTWPSTSLVAVISGLVYGDQAAIAFTLPDDGLSEMARRACKVALVMFFAFTVRID